MSGYSQAHAPQNKHAAPDAKQLKNLPPARGAHPAAVAQRAKINPQSLTPAEVMQLQQTIGNEAVCQLFRQAGLMPGNAAQKPAPAAKAAPPGGTAVIQGYNLHQVPYNHQMADEVRQARGGNDDYSGVNYATFWVNGQPTTESSNQYHSEKECWLVVGGNNGALQNIRITTWPDGNFGGNQTANQVRNNTQVSIDPVYTERQPCGGCAPLLNEILPTDANVYYTFVYPSKETKKFNHWDMDKDQYAWNALLSIRSGMSYGDQTQESQKVGRKLGNRELKEELKQWQ